MFGLGRKKTPTKVVGHTSADLGLFHMAWEKKRLPSPGVMNYAYETLGLVLFTQIGPAVAVRNPRTNLGPASLYQKAVPVRGLPTVTGTLAHAPLIDPMSPGYGSAITVAGQNDPFPRHLMQAAGDIL